MSENLDSKEIILDLDVYTKITYNQIFRTPVIFADGFAVSIQASKNHYCAPRANFQLHYDAFELGYPSEYDPLIADYAEIDNWDSEEYPGEVEYKDSMYPYVPYSVVQELLIAHGGIDAYASNVGELDE